MEAAVQNTIYVRSPLGTIKISGNQNYITNVSFHNGSGLDNPTEVLMRCKLELVEYFKHKRKIFHVPINPEGTRFQKEVWGIVAKIPFGETKSYRDIAKIMGNLNKIRAVGMANARNPVAILIPCHRVSGIDGTLKGYAWGLERKKWLLDHEQSIKQLRLFV